MALSYAILLGVFWDAGLVKDALRMCPCCNGLIEELSTVVSAKDRNVSVLEIPDLVCPPHYMKWDF